MTNRPEASEQPSPADELVAHFCQGKRLRPYVKLLCSCCLPNDSRSRDLTLRAACDFYNRIEREKMVDEMLNRPEASEQPAATSQAPAFCDSSTTIEAMSDSEFKQLVDAAKDAPMPTLPLVPVSMRAAPPSQPAVSDGNPDSRSQQRRRATQRGEPLPTFSSGGLVADQNHPALVDATPRVVELPHGWLERQVKEAAPPAEPLPGRELPDAEGHWTREPSGETKGWSVVIRGATSFDTATGNTKSTRLIYSGWLGKTAAYGCVADLPRGHWHAASAAAIPSESDRVKELEKLLAETRNQIGKERDKHINFESLVAEIDEWLDENKLVATGADIKVLACRIRNALLFYWGKLIPSEGVGESWGVKANRESIVRHIMQPLATITRIGPWGKAFDELASRVGCLYDAHADSIRAQAARLANIEAILPSTFYADRPFAERLCFMVDQWRHLLEVTQSLESRLASMEQRQRELVARFDAKRLEAVGYCQYDAASAWRDAKTMLESALKQETTNV